jgi:Subtilase family
LPSDTVLRNLTIVVEQGDLNFNGDGHLLENVTLIVKDGRVNFGDVRAVNTAVFASDGIDLNQGARFSGKNLLVTQHGDVVFDGATATIDSKDFVKVLAHDGNIFLNAAADVRGEFWSSEDFFANQASTIVGKIRAEHNITFNAPINVVAEVSLPLDSSTKNQPLIGILDTGISDNPDIDPSRISYLYDWVDGDSDPRLAAGRGNEHGTHIAGIIGAIADNGIGIDGVNQNAPLVIGRVTGSGKWATALVQYVDRFRASGQPNGLVYLGFDLTQLNADGSITTRYELTLEERSALEYARQRGVLLVVPSGNDGSVMSVLGQASQEFDNIITIGAANGLNRADYSSYGQGLDLLAPGGTIDSPILSTVGNGLGTMAGTSIAAAYATGQIANVWAANPQLSYRQVIEIVKATATDLGAAGWDEQTGSGLLDVANAVQLARLTNAEKYATQSIVLPESWSGQGLVLPLERSANWSTDFSGTIMSTIGANVRKEPSTNAPIISTRAFNPNEKIQFTKWTYGDRVTDLELGTPDERWYYDAEKGGWIASAIVRGNAPGSSPLRPTTTPNPPGNTPPPSSTAALPGKQREYRVRPGDTLTGIAERELGKASRWQDIQKLDGSKFTEEEARKLQTGQSIYLPVAYVKPQQPRPEASPTIKPKPTPTVPTASPTLEFENPTLSQTKRFSSKLALLTGRYLVEGEQTNAIIGKVTKKGDADASIGNEDILKVKTFIEGVKVKFDKERQASIEFDGGIGEISININGNVFAGIFKGDTNLKIRKGSFFDDKGEVEASFKVGLDGRYHRELSGSPWEKIFEFVKIVVLSGENLEFANNTLLDKNPDVESWLRATTQTLNYLVGGAALFAAVVSSVWFIANNLSGVGVLDDVIGLAVVTQLVKFAFKRFGIAI